MDMQGTVGCGTHPSHGNVDQGTVGLHSHLSLAASTAWERPVSVTGHRHG